MFHKKSLLFVVAAVVALTLVSKSAGYQAYQDMVPNGAFVKRRGSYCGGFGHTSCGGGGSRSSFGSAFADGGYDWATVCRQDTDGDTFTNGAELGDPDCTWIDSSSTPSRTTDITDPSDAQSFPSAAPPPPGPGPSPATPSPPISGEIVRSQVFQVLDGLALNWTATPTHVYLTQKFQVGSYGSLAVSPSGMVGMYVFAFVTGGTTPNCKIYTGSNYDVSPQDDQTGVAVHNGYVSSGMATVTCRILRSALGLSTSQQRMIFATAEWTSSPRQHSDDGKEAANVDINSGTLTLIKSKYFIIGWAVMIALFGAWIIGGFFLRSTPFTVWQNLAVQVVAGLCVLLCFLAVFLSYRADLVASGKAAAIPIAFGWAAAGGFAMLLLPTTRYAAVYRIIGSAYERTLWLHPLIGFALFVCASVHAFMSIFVDRDLRISGLIAYIFIVILTVTALLRGFSFRIFRFTHFLFIPALLFTGLHIQQKFLWVILPGLVFYVIDIILRAFNVARAGTTVVSLRDVVGNGNLTELQIKADWDAMPSPSAYCLIGVGIDPLHPFSVASYNHETKVATFYAKTVGAATARLASRAAVFTSDQAGAGIICMGPFGSPQFDLAAVEGLLLVAGGIGVTPIMYALQWLSAATQQLKLHHVNVVWALREEAVAVALEPHISSELAKVAQRGVAVQLNVMVTTAVSIPKLQHGRPNIAASANDLCKMMQKLNGAKAGIFCCGPEPLMAACASAAKDNDFYLHQETFAF
jgi:predicted ferric reductase